MMSQDNRLLPLASANESLDRPLRDLGPSSPVVATSSASEPAHLREYLAVVLKRKWLILSLVVVVTSLVAIQMYRLPSIYQASTQIQIEQKHKSVLQTGRTGDLILRGGNDPAYWNTQIKKLESQHLARQVVMRLDLQNNPAFLGAARGTGLITSLRRIISREKAPAAASPGQEAGVPVLAGNEIESVQSLTPEQARKLEPYEDTLREGLTIEPIERTNLVYIRFRHNDPQIAQSVANTIAVVFRENDIISESGGSDRALKVLGDQIVELQQQIRADEAARIAYMGSHDIPLPKDAAANLTSVQLNTYSSQMQAAEAERKAKEVAFRAADSAMQRGDVLSIPEVQENASVKRIREKIESLQSSREALMVQYTAEWPAVKQIDNQIRQLEAELDRIPTQVVSMMKTSYEASVRKENELKRSYFTKRADATQQTKAEIGLGDLNSRIETNKQLYQTYLQRQRELQVVNSDRTNNISQVEQARLPREPIGPPRVRNIMIALLLALAVGVGLAFLLDYLDDTLKSVEDVDRHLHLPTLALIPAPREARRMLGRAAPASGPGDPGTALALIEDVRSPVAEAYRHLRTSLLLSSPGQPPKTILVTSSQPSEGKTTTVVNIAMMLAQTGADVLVLDCDLRRPRVHAHFGMANARGVTNYLSGDAQVSELVQTYDRLPNLKVITSGPVPPNAAELLGSDEMRKLLYVLSENFTHIVIDSPPAISFTDASILSTMVDGVMLVVHGGRSSRAVVRRAKQQLQDVSAHLFGIVLNNVKLEANDYYYYTGYYSGYYAGDDDAAPEGAETAANGRG